MDFFCDFSEVVDVFQTKIFDDFWKVFGSFLGGCYFKIVGSLYAFWFFYFSANLFVSVRSSSVFEDGESNKRSYKISESLSLYKKVLCLLL